MTEIAELLLNNFTTICLVLGIGIIALTNSNLESKANRSFELFVFLVLALVLTNIGDFYYSEQSTPTFLHYLTSASGYTLRLAALTVMIGLLLRRKRYGVILWIPVVLVALLAFTSYYTHLMFWFDAHNNFMRGPFSYTSHILSGIYLILLIILIVKLHRHLTSGEIFVVVFSAFICVAATVLESVLSDYRFLLTSAMVTSCTLYYIILNIESYKIDTLTGLMNRRSFYLEAKKLRNKQFAVISIDLNNLKTINDSLGHSVGDKALINMGKAMLVNSGKKFLPYRVGGDEFSAIGKNQTEESVKFYISDMQTALKKSNLTASFGYAFFEPGDDLDKVCNRADGYMYENKRQFKLKNGQKTEITANIISE